MEGNNEKYPGLEWFSNSDLLNYYGATTFFSVNRMIYSLSLIPISVGSAGEGLSGGDGGHEGHRGLGGPHLSPQEIILQGQKPFKDNGKSKSSPDGIFRRGCSFTVGRLLCKAALRLSLIHIYGEGHRQHRRRAGSHHSGVLLHLYPVGSVGGGEIPVLPQLELSLIHI